MSPGWGFDALRHSDYGEGVEYCNIGKQMVIKVNSGSGNSARTDYFLVDFEKAEMRERKMFKPIMGGFVDMSVSVVENLEEVVLGHYEYIGQYGNGLYPVMKDGRCFYIDTKGKRVSEKDYETALWYLDGFAMATDGDKAYILDVDGNEWSVEDYGVDDFNERKGIGMGGDAFCLEEDGKVVYLYVTEK